MKRSALFCVTLGLLFTLVVVQPASARPNGFWPGVAVGVGSAIILGHMLQAPRAYYNQAHPAPIYHTPNAYGPPAEPTCRQRWIPGHWVEGVDHYGNYERYWVPEHWERIY
ncbi:MAG: hypothetical protein AB1585_17820 [Thermodesulfobacteriota bacterium]